MALPCTKASGVISRAAEFFVSYQRHLRIDHHVASFRKSNHDIWLTFASIFTTKTFLNLILASLPKSRCFKNALQNQLTPIPLSFSRTLQRGGEVLRLI